MPVPIVDPRGWESGGTTDTEGPGQVTHSGVEEGAMPRRSGAGPVVALVAIAMTATIGAAVWWAWPEPPPSAGAPEPAREPLTSAQVLVLVNQPDPELALDHARRHALLERLRADPEAAAKVDARLQTRLDLLQATETAEPCSTFERALQALERDPTADDAAVLARATTPAACPELADRLEALRARAK